MIRPETPRTISRPSFQYPLPRPSLLWLVLTCIALLLLQAGAIAAEPTHLRRTWQGIPGIEKTPGGRVFVAWFSGGRLEPSVENTIFLCQSDDQGQTFTEPVPMAGPRGSARAFDPTLWICPDGRLWLIFNRGDKEHSEHGVYARTCSDPDAKTPVWSEEFRVGYELAPVSFRMNKPVVLHTGEWVMPVTHAEQPVHDWFAGPAQRQGVGLSLNRGRTWELRGSIEAPHWALECMVTERLDHRLWMLIRTGGGVLWESESFDRGQTWSEGRPTQIANPGSRFFLRRLASGNLLLVNHHHFKGRSHLTAQLSTDDGATWNEGLLLDERSGVSYPDGVQDRDGLIWIVYDRDRNGSGEILLANFREEDVAAGKDVSHAVRLKRLVDHVEPLSAKNADRKLLPADWDPKAAADRVLAGLTTVTAPEVKGAHDAEMAIVKDRAYIVAEVNDEKPGEAANWPNIYAALSIVNLKTREVEKVIPFARSGQAYENETLPPGACFVPRILQKDAKTLRCYFASEDPGKRQSQTWFLDFDLEKAAFENRIHRAQIKTSEGTFNLQPTYFYADAAKAGFTRPAQDFGLYLFDSFKVFDGRTYIALNNYPIGQNGLAVLNPALDTFEVLGQYNEPGTVKLTESAVNRLPDGTWMAICRQEGGNGTYYFSTSRDGRTWTTGAPNPAIPHGASSKPTFDRFSGIYYLGWQESTRINGVGRSVFNVDVSADGKIWERKYRFETDKSFQYPVFRAHQHQIWVAVTQGDHDPSRKERIVFGLLE